MRRLEGEAREARRDLRRGERDAAEADRAARAAERRAEGDKARARQEEHALRDQLHDAEARCRELEAAEGDAAARCASLEGELAAERRLVALERQSLAQTRGLWEAAQADAAAAAARAAAAERRAVELEDKTVALAQEAGARGDPVAAATVAALRQELDAQVEEVAAARALRAEHQSQALLREQLAGAEARAARAESALAEAGALRPQVAELRRELEGWRQSLSQVPDVRRPEDITRQMLALQRNGLAAAEAKGQLEAQVAALQAEVQDLRVQAAGTVTAADDRAWTLEATAHLRLENDRLRRDAAGLRRMVDSYEKELSTKGQAAAGTAHGTRFAEAERAAAALRAQAEQLQQQVETLSQSSGAKAQQLQEARGRVSELERSLAAAEKENELATKQAAVLHERLGAGDFNRASTKVLHFVHNPEAQANEELRGAQIEALETENQALREEIKRMELKAAAAATPKRGRKAASPRILPGSVEKVAVKEAELTILKRQIASLEKKESRLKTAFQDRITVFREVCCHLFGFKIDITSTKAGAGWSSGVTAVLTPLLEETEKAQLIFNYTGPGQVELLPNEFSGNFQVRPGPGPVLPLASLPGA